MRLDRRELLRALGGLTLAACTPPNGSTTARAPAAPTRDPTHRKRILILGGTGFAGPPIVRAALARGHTVTLFNRGKTAPGLFPDVETILGDRVTQLDRLAGRDWDAVVDTWAQGPTLVGRAAELLGPRVGHYIFLSTISVYKLGRDPIDEGSPTLTLPPGVEIANIKAVTPELYGPVKALAERAAESAMPGRATSIRSGVIVGPDDPSGRFTYWPVRFSRGGDVIAPGPPRDNRMQFIDVRDLGGWIVTVAEAGHMGVYDAVGPDDAILGDVLEQVRAGVGSTATIQWIDEGWLEKNEAGGWDDFPLAVASTDEQSGFGHVSAARAIARGLRFRPIAETAKDTLAWWSALPEERRPNKRPGISAEREADLLKRWRASRG